MRWMDIAADHLVTYERLAVSGSQDEIRRAAYAAATDLSAAEDDGATGEELRILERVSDALDNIPQVHARTRS